MKTLKSRLSLNPGSTFALMTFLPTDPLNCEIMALSLALQREITLSLRSAVRTQNQRRDAVRMLAFLGNFRS